MRGRRGRADRTFVAELTVVELGLVIDVLTDFVRDAEQNAEMYANVEQDDWTIDYQLVRATNIIAIRQKLFMAEPKEVSVASTNEEQ